MPFVAFCHRPRKLHLQLHPLLRSDMEGATALTPLEIKFRFWMEWYVAHQPQIRYAEVRPSPLNTRLPMVDDCSGTYTNVRYLAGTVDPNGPSCPMVGHYKEFDGFG